MRFKNPLPYPLLAKDRQRQSRFLVSFQSRSVLFVFFSVLLLMEVTLLRAQTVSLPSSARRLSVSQESGLLCAALTINGVAFLSYQDPTPQTKVYSFPDWPTVSSLALEEKGLFLLGDRFGSLRLVKGTQDSETTSFHFEQLANWKSEGIPTCLLLEGESLYVAAGATGILIYQWTSPSSKPVLTGRYPFVDFTRQLALSPDKKTLFVADNMETAILVLNVTDPYRPQKAYSRESSFIEANANLGNLVAYGIRHRGTVLMDFTTPTAPVLKQNLPLPAPDPPTAHHRVNQVTFSPKGKLLICEGKFGARLFTWDPKTNQYIVMKSFSFPNDGCMDGVFLDETRIAFSLLSGKIDFRAIP
jgi:WD40 repeat protein